MNCYDIQVSGNRHQLVLVEHDGTRTPLVPTHATRDEAEADRAARERRNAVIREPFTAHRGSQK